MNIVVSGICTLHLLKPAARATPTVLRDPLKKASSGRRGEDLCCVYFIPDADGGIDTVAETDVTREEIVCCRRIGFRSVSEQVGQYECLPPFVYHVTDAACSARSITFPQPSTLCA
jgi:D-lyxose ketol-isomerase